MIAIVGQVISLRAFTPLPIHSPRPCAPLIELKSLFIGVSLGLVEKLPLIDLKRTFFKCVTSDSESYIVEMKSVFLPLRQPWT